MKGAWVLGLVALAGACGTKDGRQGQDARPVGFTIVVEGSVDVVLMDGLGRRDSMGLDGMGGESIPGCRREENMGETSVDTQGSPPATIFYFQRAPEWPVEIRWRSDGKEKVVVSASGRTRDGSCMGEGYFRPRGQVRLERWQIRPKTREGGEPCVMLVESLS
jgi:hypothetical protein